MTSKNEKHRRKDVTKEFQINRKSEQLKNIPISLVELKVIIIQEKISNNSYSFIDDHSNDKMFLIKKDKFWEVFYFERGSKYDLRIFKKESEACEHFYLELLKM